MREARTNGFWMANYQRAWLGGDLTAGLIVTVMLIPQSLAYAMLAGLPPQMGLYASMLPIVAYAMLGSSMTLAVGPVAVASLMTASALQPLAVAGSAEYTALAVQLSLLGGVMLLAMAGLRLGFLAHFLSHPVISGFISGSAILITIGQIKHLLGVRTTGNGTLETLSSLVHALPTAQPVTLAIGLGSLAFLWLARWQLATWLRRLGVADNAAELVAKLAPMAAVIAATALVAAMRLDQSGGVGVVGLVPAGLPAIHLALPSAAVVAQLWMPALLIALVGFVESVSVAQSLALRRGEHLVPNRELLGLGAANVASALSGAYPVTGGFARSVVNLAAGANSPLAGIISAACIALVLSASTHWFQYLPHAVLAATIVVAVTSLIDVRAVVDAWRYDRADAWCLIVTATGVVAGGVEAGILLGIGLSLGVLVWRSSHPHMAVLGRVGGTEQFRNILRHPVQTQPGVLLLRIDESLHFANISAVEDRVESLLAADTALRRVVLGCSAVNQIDATALEVLTRLEQDLGARGVELALAEVKGPVMDRLRHTELHRRLGQRIFASLHEAVDPTTSCRAPASTRPPQVPPTSCPRSSGPQ